MHDRLEQLNQQFGIQDQLHFELENDFIMISIDNQYAKAKISLYGGQVLSYQPHGEEDLLFLSKKAIYQHGKAIRGGIPICWPWFANDTSGFGRPAHGFARNQEWQVLATSAEKDGSTSVTLSLRDTEGSIAIWPYKFELELEIKVTEKLEIKLTTKNTGSKSFDITQALHAYLKIGDIRDVLVTDLDGVSYIDKTDDFVHKIQTGDLSITKEIDRVYQSQASELIVNDSTLNRRIILDAQGCKTTVIWNPWEKSATTMTDLEQDNHKHFIGVEAANADGDLVAIPAGESHCIQADYLIVTT